jgi:hypothetical protein
MLYYCQKLRKLDEKHHPNIERTGGKMTQYSIYEGNMDRLEKKLLNGFSQSIKMNKVLSYSEVSFQRLRHPVHLHQESMYALDAVQSSEQQKK